MSIFVCNTALFRVLRHQEGPLGILDLFVMGMVKGLKLSEVLFPVQNSLQIRFVKVLRLFSNACSFYFFLQAVDYTQLLLLLSEKQAEVVLCSCSYSFNHHHLH